MNGDAHNIAERVKSAATELGFDAVGICDLHPVERDFLSSWLAAGHAGSMRYMHRQAERRRNPAKIVPGARRAVVVLQNYRTPPEVLPPGTPRIARYAWGEDYHAVLGNKLSDLANVLLDLGSEPRSTRRYVDAGPVPERELARRAGLGWIGKNTLLVHPRLGSFTFIGTVFTDLPLPVDPPFRADRCGSCRRCIEACPTGALVAPWKLDARRCISYLTIEHRGPFRRKEGPITGEWLFGCDICQEVCPWNRKSLMRSNEPRLFPREDLVHPDPAFLAGIDESTFRQHFTGTALERTGPEGIARNAKQVLCHLTTGRNRPG